MRRGSKLDTKQCRAAGQSVVFGMRYEGFVGARFRCVTWPKTTLPRFVLLFFFNTIGLELSDKEGSYLRLVRSFVDFVSLDLSYSRQIEGHPALLVLGIGFGGTRPE